jgi:hypothetical protein
MTDHNCLDFSKVELHQDPYAHFSTTAILKKEMEKKVFRWLDEYEAWRLVVMDFYTQFEFSLFDIEIPPEIAPLLSAETLDTLKTFFRKAFKVLDLELVGLTAHKLVEGHRIGVHNDFLGPEETHRLIIQLNPGWSEEKGGFLMVFRSPEAEAVSKIVRPLDNTAFGFGISERSWHAVSRVNDFSRYTLVYTLKAVAQ